MYVCMNIGIVDCCISLPDPRRLLASCALVLATGRTPQNVAGVKPSERRVARGGIVLTG